MSFFPFPFSFLSNSHPLGIFPVYPLMMLCVFFCFFFSGRGGEVSFGGEGEWGNFGNGLDGIARRHRHRHREVFFFLLLLGALVDGDS